MLYLLLIVIILILIIFIYAQYKKVQIERFEDNYLYPVNDLQEICKKKYNLLPSFTPDACYNDGKLNPYANCMCKDETGECKVCYPDNPKFKTGASVLYKDISTATGF